ncbi:MAG: AAA family ATPase [Lachnospiraceae bacterium]|nr:AAA family ATPase [Lachnospiraceae bacterium]
MNIKEAKDYIKNTVKLYLKKDEYGDYRIPVMKQRPVFLLGAPGIGKTAIMEQIASELGIALVSYSMTHHTRQSALGLPFIEKKEYEGISYDVSEYTMSEIIASIYETMKESGVKEGILFLDEINCVSETLAPSMLQFLQYKVFGRHSVPQGWVIVTAGNPAEFNKSVREFDVVTMDRLKVMEVEADYQAWKAYASAKGIHNAILNFLDSNKDFFYQIETTASGRSYVTARGWEDLSDIIFLYEEDKFKVTESLVGQYLNNDKIVREFCAYYDLYNKYKTSYRVEELIKGNISDSTIEKASKAPIDERLSLVGLLVDKIKDEIKSFMADAGDLKEMMPALKGIKESDDVLMSIKKQIDARDTIIANKTKAGSLSSAEKTHHKRIRSFYERLYERVEAVSEKRSEEVVLCFNEFVSGVKERTPVKQSEIHFMFEVIKRAFGEESNEMLVAVTELTLNDATAQFMATFGSEDYDKYNALLMVSDRKESLRQEIIDFI